MQHLWALLRRHPEIALTLAPFIAATHFGAYFVGRTIVIREATAEINEANRRIEHLNERLRVALHADEPQQCPNSDATTAVLIPSPIPEASAMSQECPALRT